MTSYKYYHDGGYQAECAGEADKTARSVFEELRTKVNMEVFDLYAVVDGKYGAFLESDVKERYQFVQGFFDSLDSKRLNESPIEHCRLDYQNNISFANAKPPAANKTSPKGTLDALAKLVDAIEFGENDKPIVVLVSSDDDARNCLLHLGKVFPTDYMKRVGYCIASKRVKNIISIPTEGNPLTASIKISFVTSELSESEYRSLSERAYVFDIVNKNDNYTKQLEDISLAIERLNTSANGLATQKDKLGRIFKKDGFNKELAKIFSSKILWGCIDGVDKAFDYLRLYQNAPPEYKNELTNEVSSAITFIRQGAADLTNDQLNELTNFKKACPEHKGAIDEIWFKSAVKNVGKIPEKQEDQYVDFILKDETGEYLNEFISSVSAFTTFERYHQAFRIIAKAVVKIKNNPAIDVDVYKAAIESAIEFCDIDKMHESVAKDLTQRANGENVFKCAKIFENEEDRDFVYSILMISAYKRGVEGAERTVRITGMRAAIDDLGLSSQEAIAKIIKIRDTIIDISCRLDESYNVNDNLNNFMLDDQSHYSEDWVNEKIEELALDVLANLDSKLDALPPYEGMIKKIYKRLANVEFFKKEMANITEKAEIHKVEAVYDKIWRNEKNQNSDFSDIKTFFGNLRREDAASQKFEQFRSIFVKDLIATFSDSDKTKYLNKNKIAIFDDSKEIDTKTRIIEEVDDGYSKFEKIKQPKKKAEFILPKTILFIIQVAIIVMFIPPFIQSLVMEGLTFEPVMSYVNAYYEHILLAAPIGVAFIHLLAYKLSEKDKSQKADKAATVCGVIPAIIYAVSFLVFWFLNIDIMSMLGMK